jgi:hypothetical protein
MEKVWLNVPLRKTGTVHCDHVQKNCHHVVASSNVRQPFFRVFLKLLFYLLKLSGARVVLKVLPYVFINFLILRKYIFSFYLFQYAYDFS